MQGEDGPSHAVRLLHEVCILIGAWWFFCLLFFFFIIYFLIFVYYYCYYYYDDCFFPHFLILSFSHISLSLTLLEGNCYCISHHKVKDVSASWDIDEITVAIVCLVTCCVETKVSLSVAAVLDEDLCYKVHISHWVVFWGVKITYCRAVKLLSFWIL